MERDRRNARRTQRTHHEGGDARDGDEHDRDDACAARATRQASHVDSPCCPRGRAPAALRRRRSSVAGVAHTARCRPHASWACDRDGSREPSSPRLPPGRRYRRARASRGHGPRRERQSRPRQQGVPGSQAARAAARRSVRVIDLLEGRPDGGARDYGAHGVQRQRLARQRGRRLGVPEPHTRRTSDHPDAARVAARSRDVLGAWGPDPALFSSPYHRALREARLPRRAGRDGRPADRPAGAHPGLPHLPRAHELVHPVPRRRLPLARLPRSQPRRRRDPGRRRSRPRSTSTASIYRDRYRALDPHLERRFDQTIQLANSWGARPIVVLAPMHPSFVAALAPYGYAQRSAQVVAFLHAAARRESFTLLDARLAQRVRRHAGRLLRRRAPAGSRDAPAARLDAAPRTAPARLASGRRLQEVPPVVARRRNVHGELRLPSDDAQARATGAKQPRLEAPEQRHLPLMSTKAAFDSVTYPSGSWRTLRRRSRATPDRSRLCGSPWWVYCLSWL